MYRSGQQGIQLPMTLTIDEHRFALVTELELQKAIRLHYPVSILAILPDPEGDGEVADPPRLAGQLARVIGLVIRGTDLIRLPTATTSLHVLLVDAQFEQLQGIIQRITEEIGRRTFQINRERRPVRLSLGGACFPSTASTLRDLLAQAELRAQEARRRSRW